MLNETCTSYQDPFEEYKNRRAKKLAKRAEAEQPDKTDVDKRDDMNWFGEKLGSKDTIFGSDTSSSVGKYLSLKRPSEPVASAEMEAKKKRKLGFGDFDGW
jgi:peptidyl-prolyl cis-trans isomerase-like protein 2